MNEIQAVKTAKIEEVKKNSKKGFTLVELVVVIAILAVLAAIAIPVVASTIKSSQISSAKTNALTIETAIKEAKAAVAAGDDSIFVVGSGQNQHKASNNDITVADALEAKKITSAATKTYTIDGTIYSCVYDTSAEKVYFAGTKKGTSDIITIGDEDKLTAANVVALTTTTQAGNGKPATTTVITQNVTSIKQNVTSIKKGS